MNEKKLTLHEVYENIDLAEENLFDGGFINFGFWKDIPLSSSLTKADRVKSSENLYREVFKKMSLQKTDRIIEVGCGRGHGIILLEQQNNCLQFVGMDLFIGQINKAYQQHRAVLEKKSNLFFISGAAEKIPFADKYFNTVFSVEAIQHFDSYSAFFTESQRVLKCNGELIFTSFFSTEESVSPHLNNLFPYLNQEIDKLIPIKTILKTLADTHFTNITAYNIGEFVWYGFDKWLEITDYRDQWGAWGRNWLKAYHEKLVDYYIVTATK